MKRLDKYVAVQVVSAIAVVLLVIVGLDLVFDFIDEVADVSERYNMQVIFQYLFYRIPGRLYEYLPLSSLIGCLIGLGILASHSELTVMRAAGVSTVRIVGSVLKPAVVLAFIAMAVGEFVVPVTEQLAQSTKALAKSGGQALRSQNGVWHREDNTFIHINAVIPGGRVEGITRFEFDNNGEMKSSSFARRGYYKEDHWQLETVKKTTFSARETSVTTLESEQWRLGLTPELLSVVVVKPQDLSMSGLWSFSNYLAEQSLSADRYFFAFWSKLFQPLTIVALVLIGVLFIFGPLRSVSIGQRIITGVLIGLTFKFMQDILGQVSALSGVSPLFAVILPILACLCFGLLMLQRSKV